MRTGPVVHCDPNDDLFCSNIRFWDGVFDPDSLYIGRTSALAATPPVVEPPLQIQLLLIEDAPIPEEWLACPAAKIISFPRDTDPLGLFNAINDSGFCLPRYAMKLSELIESIPSNDFPTIARKISQILGRPVALLTPALHVLASSDQDEENQLLTRRLTRSNLSGHLSPVMLSPGDHRVWPLKAYPKKSGSLLAPIIHEGELREVLGYIYCPAIPKADAMANLSALRYIARLLVSRFLRFVRKDRAGDAAFSLLLGKVISGELKDDEIIAAQVRQAGVSEPKYMVLVTILADNLAADDLVGCADALYMDIWPQTRAALIGNQIILLIGQDDLPVIKPEELERFEALLADYQCTAGISECFQKVDHYLRNHFHRSFCAAIVAAQRGLRRCGTYGDSALYHLSSDITNVAALTPFKDAFVDPCLLRLVDYDTAHGTDYLTTLRYYWLYNRSSAAICRVLFIQRSTLFYRLTKIRELLEQDFNDYRSLIQLSVGIAILEAKGVIPSLPQPEEPPAPGKTPREEV